jgi:hypothetical protein
VNPDAELGISLIARHVRPKMADGRREPLTADFVGNLLSSAVKIHDRQVRRSERWTYPTPIWVAVIVGVFSLLVVFTRVLLPG